MILFLCKYTRVFRIYITFNSKKGFLRDWNAGIALSVLSSCLAPQGGAKGGLDRLNGERNNNLSFVKVL